jgi:hypothetical protein
MEKPQLDDLLKDHQLYHSDFQMDYFITVRSGGTTYGCYKQSLRELYKRHRGLRELLSTKQLILIDIDELQAKKEQNEFEERRNRVKLQQKQEGMADLDRNIADTERELNRFYQQACALKKSLGTIDDEKRTKLDMDMWEHKLKAMAAIDFITKGRLDTNTVEFVNALPRAWRAKILAAIKDHDKLIPWFEGQELPEIPKLLVAEPVAPDHHLQDAS